MGAINERRIQNQFGAFCVRTLKNELKTIYREKAKQCDMEIGFSDITTEPQIEPVNEYGREYIFNVMGFEVVVKDEAIANALWVLSERKRTIILLAFFIGETDGEIGNQLHVTRQAVSKHRREALEQLSALLEKESLE